jgi:hypothetical protein
MARRTASTPDAAPRTRVRRTDEQLVRDLQARIEDLQRRAQARKARQSPSVALTLKALRAVDKAIAAAEAESDTGLRHVLSDAREPLAQFLESRGVRVRKSHRPKGRRPKRGAG